MKPSVQSAFGQRAFGVSAARLSISGPWRSARRAVRPVVAALFIASFASGALAAPPPEGFADLAEKLLPSVVNISTTQTPKSVAQRGPEMPQLPPGSPFEQFFKEFFDKKREQDQQQPPQRRPTSLGSGFIVDASGYVVTNFHVIEGADEITVTLQDERILPAKIIGRDQKTDLALLKVESARPLPAVNFGDSAAVRVGDWVLAIGNPFGLGGTVTAGILSARGRDIQAGPYDDFLQTDASINKGNSGGPMFNIKGEVIGVNTAIFSPSGGSVGIGFAIPSNQVRAIVAQLRDFGRAKRGWLGVQIQSVTEEIAENLGLGAGAARGALVAGVSDGSPARKAGIQPGDVILSFDGKDVRKMRSLPSIVAETPVGRRAPVMLWRKGKEQTVTVEVAELVEAEQAASAPATGDGKGGTSSGEGTIAELGLVLAPLTPESRERFAIGKGVLGVVVTSVANGGPGAEKGLTPGDVIVEVEQEKVASPAQVQAKVAAARKEGRKAVLVLIERPSRGGHRAFVPLRLDRG
ncbi:MAG: Do family serine endopeptidase [Alphaproteobacteria bacterium]